MAQHCYRISSATSMLQGLPQFTTEITLDSVIPFLDDSIIRNETITAIKIYRKPTHTGRYLNFNFNHPPHVKRGLIQSFHKRAFIIREERQDIFNEISSLGCDLQLNNYPLGFIDSVINSKSSSHPSKEERPLSSVYIPYVKGVSEKFKCIRNRHNITITFETK
jgi:hypothetical protein